MSDGDWYFCLEDHSVRKGKQARGFERMGPYPDEATARNALQIAKARNKAADAADDDWQA